MKSVKLAKIVFLKGHTAELKKGRIWMSNTRSLQFFMGLISVVRIGRDSAAGQTASATISGRVTDSAGAVIVGATVELTSTERGTVSTAPDQQCWHLHVRQRAAGDLSAGHAKPWLQTGGGTELIVDVGSQLVQNFQLEIGSVRESVTVETTEALVNTVSATVSSVVQGAPIQDLPLNGRDTLQLALTQPGVTPQTIGTPGGPALGGFAGNGFSVAGGRSNSVTFMLMAASTTPFRQRRHRGPEPGHNRGVPHPHQQLFGRVWPQ